MITPAYLKTGDKIGIVSSARKISSTELTVASDYFKQWGLKVVLGDNIFKSMNQFSGTDDERRSDLQIMLNRKDISAIIFARGGYGTVRILDSLDFTEFIKSPKWLVGFSDVCVIHSHVLQNFNIETIHSLMPLNFETASVESIETLRKALFGKDLFYQIHKHSFNKKGSAKAILVGGNLSILYSLLSTSSDINCDGKILFLEDLDEYLYHLDRMMMNLKRSGKLKNLAGLIIGGMTIMNDNTTPFGKTAYEIIKDAVDDFNFPCCFGFPAGHFADNRALILGREINMEVDENVRIQF